MLEYVINVAEVENLQTLEDKDALDNIFARAERTVIGGGVVLLIRRSSNGSSEKFDEFSTEADLAEYKKRVYKYL